MTENELRQYRSLRAEAEEIEERIRNAVVVDSVKGSSPEYPYIEMTISLEGESKREDLKHLRGKRDWLMRRIKRIESFIDGISDSELRRIFQYRYIWGKKKMSWQRIAFKLEYSDEGSPRKKHEKFLNLSENSEKHVV